MLNTKASRLRTTRVSFDRDRKIVKDMMQVLDLSRGLYCWIFVSFERSAVEAEVIINIRVASCYLWALLFSFESFCGDFTIAQSRVRVDLLHANGFYRGVQWPLHQGIDSRSIHVETSRDNSSHSSNMRKEKHDTCTQGYDVRGWVGWRLDDSWAGCPSSWSADHCDLSGNITRIWVLLSCCDQYSVITHSVRTKVYLNHPTDRNTQNQIRLKSIRLAMVLPHECWTHAKPQSNSKTVDPFQKLNGMLSR